MKIAVLSETGKKRKANQDAYAIIEEDSLFIIADGMGGHQGGETASRLAVTEIEKFFKYPDTIDITLTDIDVDPLQQRLKNLKQAIRQASRVISREARIHPEMQGMGTTVVVLQLVDDKAFVLHVGDSRLYRIHGREIRQITKDHSRIQELIDAQQISAEEAEHYPFKNVITRALGGHLDIEIDTASFPYTAGDAFLLCTDGICGVLKEHEILECLAPHGTDAEAALKAIADLVEERGSPDNYTGILLVGDDWSVNHAYKDSSDTAPILIERIMAGPSDGMLLRPDEHTTMADEGHELDPVGSPDQRDGTDHELGGEERAELAETASDDASPASDDEDTSPKIMLDDDPPDSDEADDRTNDEDVVYREYSGESTDVISHAGHSDPSEKLDDDEVRHEEEDFDLIEDDQADREQRKKSFSSFMANYAAGEDLELLEKPAPGLQGFKLYDDDIEGPPQPESIIPFGRRKKAAPFDSDDEGSDRKHRDTDKVLQKEKAKKGTVSGKHELFAETMTPADAESPETAEITASFKLKELMSDQKTGRRMLSPRARRYLAIIVLLLGFYGMLCTLNSYSYWVHYDGETNTLQIMRGRFHPFDKYLLRSAEVVSSELWIMLIRDRDMSSDLKRGKSFYNPDEMYQFVASVFLEVGQRYFLEGSEKEHLIAADLFYRGREFGREAEFEQALLKALYQLGRTAEERGDFRQSLHFYQEIQKITPAYQDTSARIERIMEASSVPRVMKPDATVSETGTDPEETLPVDVPTPLMERGSEPLP